jgi:CheY-like chemotaxis protein/anti-sigma regulatory factor (Ser/Thr protein kinase)
VWADHDRLEQVFVNLLNNAIKYSDPGRAIVVSLTREDDQAVVSFLDEGLGLESRDLDRVFEPFVQLDPSRAREDGGLGIGLTLVRHLVELHGGRVAASSEGKGRGSVFTVRLPALPCCDTAADAAGAKPLYRARPRSEPQRILVVDDNLDSAQSLAMLLQIGGHDVRTAHDGLDALGAAAEFQPQVVLLDLGMPRMDGFEAARRLRCAPRGRDLLLLALSGWSHDDDKLRSREAGFDEHLVKPVDPELLGEILSSHARSRRHAGAPPL